MNFYTDTNMDDCIITKNQLFLATRNFLIISSSLLSGIFLGVSCIAWFMYGHYEKGKSKALNGQLELSEVEEESEGEGKSEGEEVPEDDIAEEDRYYLELAALENRQVPAEELEELRFKTVTLQTPEREDIIMLYNSDTETFWYYVNNNSIVRYSTLDAIARYYAIKYNCKSICVNYKDEIEKGLACVKDKQELNKINETNNALLLSGENNVTTKPRSVFAKFKNYNTSKKPTTAIANSKAVKEYYVLTERANRFKYRGKLAEYLAVDKNAGLNLNKLGYSSFKLLQTDKANETKKFD